MTNDKINKTLYAHWFSEPNSEHHPFLRSLLDDGIELSIGKTLPETAYPHEGVGAVNESSPHILISGKVMREQVIDNPNLRAIIIPWAGLPAGLQEMATEFPHISVHNSHHNARPVAESVLALMLAAAKLIVPIDQALRRHDWSYRYEQPRPLLSLAGKTALILGYGQIGQRVGALCQAFGMRVLTIRRSVKKPQLIEGTYIYPSDALHDLLPQANFLLACLPLTPQTRGLIGQAEFALLPDDAILINVGRGSVIDEAALYEALRNGRLHSAGLDVWYNYPKDKASRTNTPPANFPFHELENVVMSPHRADEGDDTERLRMIELAEMLNTAVKGNPIPNKVDLTNGY